MKATNSTWKNIIGVAFSRGISLLSGIAAGLLLPKMFSVSDYGYLKIFTLYIGYTALLHFGFVDGILLKYAGVDYDELNKEKFRTYTRFFAVFQIVIGSAVLAGGLLFSNPEYRFIFLMLGINMVLINITTYYQFVSQATQRFAEYSAKSLMVSACKLIFVLVLMVLQLTDVIHVSYRLYIIGLNVIDGVILLWYMYIYRDITFGNRLLKEYWNDIASIFQQGIILTVAYQVSHLVLALDRQFVSVLFPMETYAVYSFAYHIVTMISTVISSLAVVLLPVLRRVKADLIRQYYKNILSVVAMLTGLALCCYFPLHRFIKWFLPNYESSAAYLQIVLPALMYSCCISVVMFTFCKVLGLNAVFFKNGCMVLGLGFLLNTAAYLLFKTPQSLSYASLVTMAIWFLIEDVHLGNVVHVSAHVEFCYLSLLAVGFILIVSLTSDFWLGTVSYVIYFLLVTTVLYRRLLWDFLKMRLEWEKTR